MVKKFNTLQDGIKSSIKDLTEAEIFETTRKYAGVARDRKYFYKLSDDNQHDIHHKYSVALDIACVQKNKIPSMFKAHEAMIEKYFESTDGTSNQEITFYLGQIMEEVGQLTTTVVEGMDDGIITQGEQKEIRLAIKKTEEALVKLKSKIGQKVGDK